MKKERKKTYANVPVFKKSLSWPYKSSSSNSPTLFPFVVNREASYPHWFFFLGYTLTLVSTVSLKWPNLLLQWHPSNLPPASRWNLGQLGITFLLLYFLPPALGSVILLFPHHFYSGCFQCLSDSSFPTPYNCKASLSLLLISAYKSPEQIQPSPYHQLPVMSYYLNLNSNSIPSSRPLFPLICSVFA